MHYKFQPPLTGKLTPQNYTLLDYEFCFGNRSIPDRHEPGHQQCFRQRSHSHHGRMYLNFPGHGEEGEKMLEDTFGENYSRLREIKRKYDPDNRFCFNQNLKPAG